MIALTPAQGRLLRALQERSNMGAMWLVHAGRGRYALVVPELYEGGPLARLLAVSGDTIWDTDRAGLITVDPLQAPLTYRYRTHLDGRTGQQVRLTWAGWRTCPACGAQDTGGVLNIENCATSSGRDHQARQNAAALHGRHAQLVAAGAR